MKVKDLIIKLQEFDLELDVLCYDEGFVADIVSVQLSNVLDLPSNRVGVVIQGEE